MTDDLAPMLSGPVSSLAPALGGGRVAGHQVDSRALKILLNTYWTSAGWRRQPETRPEDFAYAVQSGLMFPPRRFSHDGLIRELKSVCDRLTPQVVGAAFVASLGSRRLDLRSPLGSYAFWRHAAVHAIEVDTEHQCIHCGEYAIAQSEVDIDLNVLNFERHKWAGVRHHRPDYAWLDLFRFEATSFPSPLPDDFAVLRNIVKAVCEAPTGAKPKDLEKALAGVVKSNQAERQVLIQILAYAGVLNCQRYPSFLHRYVPPGERVCPGNEWGYPAGWWRGGSGVNFEALALYFGENGLPD
ncbi:hypothetical protein D3C72_356150 [compost metagenome]